MNRYVFIWAAVCCAIGVMAVASNPASADILDGLYAYWAMDGNLRDAVDINHDGVLLSNTGATPTFDMGMFGQAIDLDKADNQRIQVGDITNESDFDFVGGSISISAWFTVEAFDSTWQALVAKGEGTSWRVARRSSSNVMSYAGGVSDIPDNDTTGPNVNDAGAAWHHIVAITENAVSTRLWVDGGLVATSAGAPTITKNSTNPMLIGDNPDTGAGRSWNGMIDDLGIWTRVLTPDEIASLWNNGTGAAIGDLGIIYESTDFNKDQLVNLDDYDILASNFLSAGDQSQGDATNDGFIDLEDFTVWRRDYEDPSIPGGPAAGSAIPEPSAILLSVLLFAGILGVTRAAHRRVNTGA